MPRRGSKKYSYPETAKRKAYKRKWEREKYVDCCVDCGTLITANTITRRCVPHASTFLHRGRYLNDRES